MIIFIIIEKAMSSNYHHIMVVIMLVETEQENILTTVEDISEFVQLKSVIGEKQKDKYNLRGVY